MVTRLVTILVLVVAIGSISWGMRAEAQNITLEERVAELEARADATDMQLYDLAGRALPPRAPRQDDNAVFGFFTLEPGYTFEISCNIETYPMGTQYRLDCMRFALPGSTGTAPPAPAEAPQPASDAQSLVEFHILAEDGTPVGGACVELGDIGAIYASVCDNDPQDGDPRDGFIVVSVAQGTYIVDETRAPDGVSAADDGFVITVGATTTVVTLTHQR